MPDIIKQQTIVMHIDTGRVFEEFDESGNKCFVQTDFDVKIEEFIQNVMLEGGQVLYPISTSVTNEYLVAIISFIDKPLAPSIARPSLQIPKNIT